MLEFSEPLPKGTLDIEGKSRSNLFSWRGQFSPQLIESLIHSYCSSSSVVMDPFAGSGTVLYESGVYGLECYGFEINPAAWVFSKTYEFINVPRKQREAVNANLGKLLEEHFPIDIFTQQYIDHKETKSRIDAIESQLEDHGKILLNTLVILLDLYNREITCELVLNKFTELAHLVIELPESSKRIKTELRDARNLPLTDESVDFVITSPPYINVFNYHQNYRKTMESLGWDLLKVARSEIGSNRANRGNRFLTVIQYCLDMAQVLSSFWRVLNRNGKAIIVVGHESSVLGVPFFNAHIIKNLGTQTRLFNVVLEQKREFKNKFGKIIREDLLHFVKNGEDNPDSEAIINIARDVASIALVNGRQFVSEKNQEAVCTAIDRVSSIIPTTIFDVSNYESYYNKDRVMMINEG